MQFGQIVAGVSEAEFLGAICSVLEADGIISAADSSEPALSREGDLFTEEAGRKSATVTDLLFGVLAFLRSREATTSGGRTSGCWESPSSDFELLLSAWPCEKRALTPRATRWVNFAKVEEDGPRCMSGH